MASISPVSPGISDLIQAFSVTAGSPLSSPSLQTAVEKASPRDIVQISEAALQLQQAGNLFGSAGTTQTSTDPATLLQQAVASSVAGATPSV